MLLLWGLCFCNQSRGRVESGEREKRKRKRKGNGGGRMGQVTIALNAIPPWYVPAKRNNMCHFEDVHTCIFFKTRYRSKLCFTVHVPNSQFHPTKYTAPKPTISPASIQFRCALYYFFLKTLKILKIHLVYYNFTSKPVLWLCNLNQTNYICFLARGMVCCRFASRGRQAVHGRVRVTYEYQHSPHTRHQQQQYRPSWPFSSVPYPWPLALRRGPCYGLVDATRWCGAPSYLLLDETVVQHQQQTKQKRMNKLVAGVKHKSKRGEWRICGNIFKRFVTSRSKIVRCWGQIGSFHWAD